MEENIYELIESLCPEGVEYRKLGEVAKILNGYAFQSKQYAENGIRVIRISDVQKGTISDKDIKYYPNSFENEIRRYLLVDGDLVMSLTGNVGRVAMISKSELPAALNQRVACIRPKDLQTVNTRFLYHYFDRDIFEVEATSNSAGGGQKNLSTTWLSDQMIPVPPMEVQQEVVRILDKFTALQAQLQAELQARRRQYEYYRDKLLTFNKLDNEGGRALMSSGRSWGR